MTAQALLGDPELIVLDELHLRSRLRREPPVLGRVQNPRPIRGPARRHPRRRTRPGHRRQHPAVTPWSTADPETRRRLHPRRAVRSHRGLLSTMGAFTLSRLIWLEASRRPRALFAVIMLALSAGFPDPARPRRRLRHPDLARRPARLQPRGDGLHHRGGEFTAFAGAVGVLAMTVVAPMKAWRALSGIAGAPAWRIALGGWVAAFGVGLFLLTAIWAGALVRGWSVLERQRRSARQSVDLHQLGVRPGRCRGGCLGHRLHAPLPAPGDAARLLHGGDLHRLDRDPLHLAVVRRRSQRRSAARRRLCCCRTTTTCTTSAWASRAASRRTRWRPFPPASSATCSASPGGLLFAAKRLAIVKPASASIATLLLSVGPAPLLPGPARAHRLVGRQARRRDQRAVRPRRRDLPPAVEQTIPRPRRLDRRGVARGPAHKRSLRRHGAGLRLGPGHAALARSLRSLRTGRLPQPDRAQRARPLADPRVQLFVQIALQAAVLALPLISSPSLRRRPAPNALEWVGVQVVAGAAVMRVWPWSLLPARRRHGVRPGSSMAWVVHAGVGEFAGASAG